MSITWIAPDFAVSPQLQPNDLPEVAAAGYCAIVNNRPDGEAPGQPSSHAIGAAARQLELDYAYIPVVPGAKMDDAARQLDLFLRESEGPVLAFCRSGRRSAALWTMVEARQGSAGR